MEWVAASLYEIEVLEEYFNEENLNKEKVDNRFRWLILYNYKIEEADDGVNMKILIEIDYKLPHFYFPENIIVAIKTCSKFLVKGELSIQSRMDFIAQIMTISMCNLQGYCIAKTEGTDLKDEMPPTFDFNTVKNNFKYRLEHEWK